ncbi:MAG TPA: hypothetical protein ENJ44_06050 [Oceanospirillales bacterium]|nr:hypothetical protein [Oceanospirillales bacterium]
MAKYFYFAFFSSHIYADDMGPWNSTKYIYLAKPIYIYTSETTTEAIAGKLEGKVSDLIIKIKQEIIAGKRVHYFFEIIDVIYGEKVKTKELVFKYYDGFNACQSKKTFNNHANDDFWIKKQGRSEFILIKISG